MRMLAVQNSHELIYIWSVYFPFESVEKCMIFKDIFPGHFRTLRFNFKTFRDFPGPGNFKKKSTTFQEVWEP